MCSDTADRIDFQHAVNEILCLVCDSVPFGRRVIVSAVFNLRIQIVLIFVPKRRIADEQDVQDDTYRAGIVL